MSHKLVYGMGVNNLEYTVSKYKYIDHKYKRTWVCPFYERWKDVLRRAYSKHWHSKYPTYVGCSVDESWIYSKDFKDWMETQDWEGKHLDKDILFPGNKVYGPDTCVFVDQRVNNFLLDRQRDRGNSPIGTYFDPEKGKFKSSCSDVLTARARHLGYYDTSEEAHHVWLSFKLEQAKILAAEQVDPRVAKALVERYENYIPSSGSSGNRYIVKMVESSEKVYYVS